RSRFVLVEFDDVFHGVAAEPLDGVGGRLPVFLTRSEERHPERLDLDRSTHFAEKRPDLPRSFLPKRDLGEHLLRNPIALAPEFDDFFAGGSSRNGALAGGSGQAVEARSVVFRATVHAPASSFAQKNPPVSLRGVQIRFARVTLGSNSVPLHSVTPGRVSSGQSKSTSRQSSSESTASNTLSFSSGANVHV